jgi:hypothetical protein
MVDLLSDSTEQVGDFFRKVSVPPLRSLGLRGELRSLITTETQRTQRTHREFYLNCFRKNVAIFHASIAFQGSSPVV